MDLTLDINDELYPVQVREKLALVLSAGLSMDGKADDGSYDQNIKDSLADKYEYVMHGKVYKYDSISASKVAVYISYGGLLMRLEGDPRHVSEISIGSNLYLLLRKV
jgi:DNA-directed RNA polymerase I, II, and III subunit RPABC3